MARALCAICLFALLTGCGDDASPPDAGPPGRLDAGPSSDARAPDASGARDAGDRPRNDACEGAIEIAGGGTFEGDTCAFTDTMALTCGEAGQAEALYVMTVPPMMWSCDVTFAPGLTFEIGYDAPDCPGSSGGTTCAAHTMLAPDGSRGTVSFGGGEEGRAYWLAVERAEGPCGPFEFTVECAPLI